MGRRKFGWSYPPGAARDPNAPYNQPAEPPEGTEIEHSFARSVCHDCDEELEGFAEDVAQKAAFDHPECEVELLETWTETEVL